MRGNGPGNVLQLAVTRIKYFRAKDGTKEEEYFSNNMKIICRGIGLTVPERNF